MKMQLNHNTALAEEATRQVKANDGYCPCSLEKTPETKCICKEFLEKMEKNIPGECHCGRYEILE